MANPNDGTLMFVPSPRSVDNRWPTRMVLSGKPRSRLVFFLGYPLYDRAVQSAPCSMDWPKDCALSDASGSVPNLSHILGGRLIGQQSHAKDSMRHLRRRPCPAHIEVGLINTSPFGGYPARLACQLADVDPLNPSSAVGLNEPVPRLRVRARFLLALDGGVPDGEAISEHPGESWHQFVVRHR